jgi:SAM-dependent methyltransferase
MRPDIADHLAFLKERVFQVRTKWPHFNRMLDDILELAELLPTDATVVIFERAYVYGGTSLFAPLFRQPHVIVVDCEIPTTRARDGYQASWTDDPRCIHVKADLRRRITDSGLGDATADAILIPNLVHHEPHQASMFAEVARILKPDGRGYIFEALLREMHQIPDDYLRYTPYGLANVLSEAGLDLSQWRPTGGPFEAISYCWIQALQYIPEPERAARERWFFDEHLKELLELDRRYPRNQVRQHTSFPLAYSAYFQHAQVRAAA